jgi:hypothetical protein
VGNSSTRVSGGACGAEFREIQAIAADGTELRLKDGRAALVARPHDREFALPAKPPQGGQIDRVRSARADPVSQSLPHAVAKCWRVWPAFAARVRRWQLAHSEQSARGLPSLQASPRLRCRPSSPSCQVSKWPVMPQASRVRQLSNVGVMVRSPSTGPLAVTELRAVDLAPRAIFRAPAGWRRTSTQIRLIPPPPAILLLWTAQSYTPRDGRGTGLRQKDDGARYRQPKIIAAGPIPPAPCGASAGDLEFTIMLWPP